MAFVGLEREFSYSVASLAAEDPDMSDFFRLRMVDDYAAELTAERVNLLQGFSQLEMRSALKTGYQLSNRDVIIAVVRGIENVLKERGIKVGFYNGNS